MLTDRIQLLINTAAKLFIQQGYAKTQIAHIAESSGISVGTVYNVFSGKKELMHCVLKATIDPLFISENMPIPISDENFTNLETEIEKTFAYTLKEFRKPLETKNQKYDFKNLVSDLFEMLWKYAIGCLFIEKNTTDCGSLFTSYKNYRKQFFTCIQDYLADFTRRGIIRSVPDPEMAVIMIIETVSWWAMDMRYDSFDMTEISPDRAKAVCIDFLVRSYSQTAAQETYNG